MEILEVHTLIFADHQVVLLIKSLLLFKGQNFARSKLTAKFTQSCTSFNIFDYLCVLY